MIRMTLGWSAANVSSKGADAPRQMRAANRRFFIDCNGSVNQQGQIVESTELLGFGWRVSSEKAS